MMRVLVMASFLLFMLFVYAQITTARGAAPPAPAAQCAPAAAPPAFPGRASHTNGMSSSSRIAEA
jgi:hypothetical protein